MFGVKGCKKSKVGYRIPMQTIAWSMSNSRDTFLSVGLKATSLKGELMSNAPFLIAWLLVGLRL